MAEKKMTKKEVRRSKWRSSIEKNEKLHLRNSSTKSELKTRIKKAKSSGSKESVAVASKALDKAAERGIIHKNQAGRRKSRMMKAANKVSSS